MNSLRWCLLGAMLITSLQAAQGISISISSDGSGLSEQINAGCYDELMAKTTLSNGVTSETIVGSGNYTNSHWVSNDAGAFAEEGVYISGANHYEYGYVMVPGLNEGHHGTEVSASQTLEIQDAANIYSYTRARSSSGYEALTKIDATGSLSQYSNQAVATVDSAEATMMGHVLGTFTGISIAVSESRSKSKTRTSNYGSKYDLAMTSKAFKDATASEGCLGYYVDINNPNANMIQGAVGAAEPKDTIKVTPGTYCENVVIDKSLDVIGSSPSLTIVDGQRHGPVFAIGRNERDIDVTLSGLTIQNGWY